MFVLNKFNWICNYPVAHLTNWPVCLKKEGNRFITHVWQRKNKLIETFYLLYLQTCLFLVLFYNAVILLLDVVQYTHLMQISQILLPRKYLISPRFKFHLFMLFNRYTSLHTILHVRISQQFLSLIVKPPHWRLSIVLTGDNCSFKFEYLNRVLRWPILKTVHFLAQ